MVNADDKAVYPYTGFFAITPPPPSDPSIIEADGGKWIRLPSDGRLVEYFVHGSTKNDAAILVDCPGGGATGALVGKLPGVAEWCEAHNVKIISPSYPGFGHSEVRPGWTIGEWPKSDLEPILEQEGVTDSFMVTGTSFGTPHAQAMAVYFGERVKVLGLRVPYVGRHVSEDVGLPLGQANMRYDSKSCNTNLIGHVIGKAFMSTVSDPASFFDEPSGASRALISCLQPKALEQIKKLNNEHEDAMQCLKYDVNRGVVVSGQGWLYMCATDTLLDHKFDVRDIKQNKTNIPVIVWYAEDDEDCPPSHGAWLVEEFEGKSRLFSGLGHVGAAFVDHVKFLDEVRMAA